MKKILFSLFIFIIILSACTVKTASTEQPLIASPTRTTSIEDSPPETSTSEPFIPADNTPLPTPAPGEWKALPVVPGGVTDSMREVYQRGLAAGRAPDRFSKFGDCQSVPSLFLGTFDDNTYQLGDEYAHLQETIDYFSGSWGRESIAVKGGLNVAAVQTLYYTDPEHCELTESPMVCELKVYNPSLVLISFETWWADKPTAGYDERLRAIVDYVLSQDVVPILATKADNLEGDDSINAAIARIAFDYQLPLWNFWAATQVLPNFGLSDGFHLTFAQNIFDDPVRMQDAWPWRNLTALQTIDSVYRSLINLP